MLMLQVCIDDSGSDLQGPAYVLAGYLSTAEQWAKFSDEWHDALWESPAISYFKLSEANRLDGEFRGWTHDNANKKVDALSKVIAPRVMYQISSIMVQAHYDEIIMPFRKVIVSSPSPEDKRFSALLKTPYYLCFYDVITECMKQLGVDQKLEPIEFYFDDQGLMGRRTAGFWDAVKAEAPPEYAKYMTTPPQFRDEKTFLPLQAADMIAGLTTGLISDRERGINLVRPPFYNLKSVRPLMSAWGKDRLTKLLEDHMGSRTEYEKFDSTMKQLIKVPHSVVRAKLDEEKAAKRIKKRKTKPSGRGENKHDQPD
jgi:hypothetical protein